MRCRCRRRVLQRMRSVWCSFFFLAAAAAARGADVVLCVCVCVWHLTEDKCDRNGVSGPIICNIRPATFKSTHIRAIFRVTATFCADSFNPKSSHPSSFTLSLHPPLFFFLFPSYYLISPLQQTLQFQSSDSGNERNASFTPRLLSQKLSYLPPSSFFVSLHLPFHSSLQVLLHLPTNPLSFTPPFPSPFLSFISLPL